MVLAAFMQDNKALLADLILFITVLVDVCTLALFDPRRQPRIKVVLHQEIVVKGTVNVILLECDARKLLVWLFSKFLLIDI